jgi:uncharacterized membrane protein
MLRRKLRSSLVTGIAIVTPVIISVLIIKILYDWSMILVTPLIQTSGISTFTGGIELLSQAVAVTVALLTTLLIGAVSKTRPGKIFLGETSKIAGFIPLFGNIYFTVKQVTNSLSSSNSRFKRAVIVEYPKEGFRSIGFITGKANPELQKEFDEELYNIYIPHSPNPTVGEFKLVNEDEITETDMSVKKALKLAMTMGLDTKKEQP